MWTGPSWAQLLASFSATSSTQYAFHVNNCADSHLVCHTNKSSSTCRLSLSKHKRVLTNHWSHSKHEIPHHFLTAVRNQYLNAWWFNGSIVKIHKHCSQFSLTFHFVCLNWFHILWLYVTFSDRKAHLPRKSAHLPTLLDKWQWQWTLQRQWGAFHFYRRPSERKSLSLVLSCENFNNLLQELSSLAGFHSDV